MIRVYKLHNQFKHYEWGSPEIIPQFLNIRNKSLSGNLPYAEMWMGTHSGGPSQVKINMLEKKHLSELAGELPFLFKLIAVNKQLSIQVHPNKAQAEEGFKNENEEGIFLKAPTRNYKDENHKPEIICAITPFSMMAGFRDCGSIYRSFEELSVKLPQLKEILSPLLKALKTELLTVFIRVLYNFSKLEREYISNVISNTEEKNCDHITPEQWRMIKNFSLLYPGDPAVLSPLFLNIIHLSPFQAVYVPAGTLHSYTSGFGAELMASSDNVLRGGLTPKYVNISKFVSIIDYKPCKPDIITPDESHEFFYKTPCGDFSLALIRGSGRENIFPVKEPAICIVMEGELRISGLQTEDLVLTKGQSFFIPGEECERTVSFSGNYSLFAAAGFGAYSGAGFGAS